MGSFSNLEDRGLAWEIMTKLKIRYFSVPFCVKVIERLEFKNLLEKQSETLQVEIDSSNENVNHETYYNIKKELEEIERLKTKSKMLDLKLKLSSIFINVSQKHSNDCLIY